MRREIGDMSLDLFRKIVSEAANLIKHIRLHFMGEPLLHPNLLEMIDLCSSSGIRTLLSTNATLLDGAMSKKLLRSGLSTLIISFDGVKKNSYEKIRRGANFENIEYNVLRFFQKRESLGRIGPDIYLNIIETKITKDELPEFRKRWEKFKDDKLFINKKEFTDWAEQVPNFKNLKIEHNDRQNIRLPCDILWLETTILQDGKVVPCCRDFDGTTILGDVNNKSIKSIWNGKEIRWLRSKHLEGRQDEISLCKNCNDWKGYHISSIPSPSSYIPVVWYIKHIKNRLIGTKCNCFWCVRT